jgi:hypothetical protein
MAAAVASGVVAGVIAAGRARNSGQTPTPNRQLSRSRAIVRLDHR